MQSCEGWGPAQLLHGSTVRETLSLEDGTGLMGRPLQNKLEKEKKGMKGKHAEERRFRTHILFNG